MHVPVLHPYPYAYAKTRTTAGHATPERSSKCRYSLALQDLLVPVRGVEAGEPCLSVSSSFHREDARITCNKWSIRTFGATRAGKKKT